MTKLMKYWLVAILMFLAALSSAIAASVPAANAELTKETETKATFYALCLPNEANTGPHPDMFKIVDAMMTKDFDMYYNTVMREGSSCFDFVLIKMSPPLGFLGPVIKNYQEGKACLNIHKGRLLNNAKVYTWTRCKGQRL